MSIITVSFWNCDGLAGREKINNNNNKSNHMEVWYTPKKRVMFFPNQGRWRELVSTSRISTQRP